MSARWALGTDRIVTLHELVRHELHSHGRLTDSTITQHRHTVGHCSRRAPRTTEGEERGQGRGVKGKKDKSGSANVNISPSLPSHSLL